MSITCLFGAMAFRHSWRSYQARILDDLEAHLDDRKLHIVAAPGAGKTVLGLEIIRKLGLRTLVLAPSLLVRDQWIDRLRSDFLSDPDVDLSQYVSTDPAADVVFRVSTYQSIHQRRGEVLPACELLCLDEAHHLRKSWWHTLSQLAERHDCVTLSLTATPPYDAVAHEWANYDALCGPIDAEISAPELVATSDLCPHQDLVYTAVTTCSAQYMRNVQEEAESFSQLRADREMLAQIAAHSWIVDCKKHADEILNNAQLFSAMLVYLQDAGCSIPTYARRLLQIEIADIPSLSWDWLEFLFAGLKKDLPATILDVLARSGALHNDRITLPARKFTKRTEILQDDASRMQACLEIHALERSIRGPGLRQAILVDRVGRLSLKSALPTDGYNAASMFQRLLSDGDPGDLAIMTGQFIVLPRGLAEGIESKDLPDAAGYVLLMGRSFDAAVTRANQAFRSGKVQVVIGTQAFLGQGWDAPSLNSLILGTNLSSFVAVNQLRGRALRIDRFAPEKSANIWHLAILPDEDVVGEDLTALERRFACFARIDRDAGEIRSYFAPEQRSDVQNAKALRLARSYETLHSDWAEALDVGDDIGGRLVRESCVNWRQSQLILPRPRGVAHWFRGLIGQPISEAEVERMLLRLARVVLESLRQLSEIRTDHDARLYVARGAAGFSVGVQNASRFEETLFHDTLRELLNPVANPRYLIQLPSGLFRRNAQFFAVPSRFDSHKRRAQVFWRNWQAMVGRGTLTYTRTIAGRGVLQAARLKSAGHQSETHLLWR